MNGLKFFLAMASLCMVGFIGLPKDKEELKLSEHSIIPKPLEVTEGEGVFTFKEGTGYQLIGEADDLNYALDFFKDFAQKSMGIKLDQKENGKIQISMDDSRAAESYELNINPNGIKVTAADGQGLFYAFQTIRQLLPADAEKGRGNGFSIPAGKINDKPEYEYRGVMLDVSRHFFPVEDVKSLIDQVAKYKVNKLHLHLSDDQGWRIEIKSWPNLTKIGGSTQVGGGDGGYYTQEDYKDIVAYAASKFITVIPEIDMPGHTNAVLASYGEFNPGVELPETGRVPVDRKALGVDGEDSNASDLYTGIKVGFSTLDTKKEITYEFIEDVIREIAEITPGPYFHIGGDESLVTELEDYKPFIERAQALVTKYGKTSIGWDEIAHADLEEGTIAQFWAKEKNIKLAADQGNKIIMSPSKHIYLDMKYDTTTRIGHTWAGLIEIDQSYNWNPTQLVEGVGKELILGVEAPLWTESVENRDDIEYMVFPRITALAEIGWTPQSLRKFDNYKNRLRTHMKRWDAMGINYYKSPLLEK
ncbi:beta-N-acetylhexosaminidase [Litoribacter populi]|uniref:beta-N-acetylhexosaminidase n=1 Tax=Litoribacter populi TaxID=2598460 RepID=UPI001C8F6BAF|nr:beta-N-acetylhexosaminidase [Litoribacter populi]